MWKTLKTIVKMVVSQKADQPLYFISMCQIYFGENENINKTFVAFVKTVITEILSHYVR